MSIRLVKPVTRIVEIDKGLVNVTLDPNGIVFREWKRRKSFILPYGSAFVQAVVKELERQRKERQKNRKLKVQRGKL